MNDNDRAMPQSSGSTDGASGGSLGGASSSDLMRGYIPMKDEQHPDACECEMCMAMAASQRGGFLGRPQGWER